MPKVTSVKADRKSDAMPSYFTGRGTFVRSAVGVCLTGLTLGGACAMVLSTARSQGKPLAPLTTAPAPKPALTRAVVAKPILVAQKSAEPAQPTVEAQDAETTETRRPLSFYTEGVRSNMFHPPLPPEPKPSKAPRVTIPKPVSIPVAPINPFADWAYTGTVHMGDDVMALMENTKTKEGQYIRANQTFLGAEVTSITDQMITLKSGGKPTMLAKSDNITVTPLDKNAGFLDQKAATPGMPGADGQPVPGAMPGMMAMPPGVVSTDAQAAGAQRGQRRNRGNRGGGGAGRFRGGAFGQ